MGRQLERIDDAIGFGAPILGLAARLHAEQADAGLAERRIEFLEARRGGQRDALAATVDEELQGLVGRGRDDPLQLVEAGDLLAVDLQHEVARQEARRLGRAAHGDAVDARGKDRTAIGQEDAGENGDREDKIGDRARRDGRRAFPDRLRGEGHRPLRRRHGFDGRVVGHAGAVGVAVELDVAAEREQRDAPARAVAVDEGEELRPEADGEGVDLDAAAPADPEMSEFVEKDHDRQDKDERDHVDPGRVQRIQHVASGSALLPSGLGATTGEMVTEPLPCRIELYRPRRSGNFL